MYLSLNWLNAILTINHFDLKKKTETKKILLNKNFNTNLLTLNGFEIDNIETRDNDIILQLDTTPNRLDTLNMLGLSCEISHLLNITRKQNSSYTQKQKTRQQKLFEDQNNETSNRIEYSYIEICNLRIPNSPPWLKKRLKTNNIESKNYILDLVQYCQLEWGHCINIYDLDKIKQLTNQTKPEISLKKTNDKILINKKIQTIKNKYISLKSHDTLLNLSGISSADETQITNETKNIIVECAIYPQVSTRKLMQEIGLNTKTGKIFSKGVSDNNLTLTIQRFLKLITLSQKSTQIKIWKKNWQINKKNKIKKITLPFNQIQMTLGDVKTKKENRELTQNEIFKALNQIGFKPKRHETNITISVPPFRQTDIKTNIDVIEEVGRVYGFNKFQAKLPTINQIGNQTLENKLCNQSRQILITMGFNESIHYSLTNKLENNTITLKNGVGLGANLRTSLLYNLINSCQYNNNNNDKKFEVFEIGRVFNRKHESTYISGLFGYNNMPNNWVDKPTSKTWINAKSRCNSLFHQLKIKINWKPIKKLGSQQTILFHLRKTAKLQINKKNIGIFTQINPIYAKKFNLPQEIFFFEINLTKIAQLIQDKTEKFNYYPNYPAIVQDLTISLPKNVKIEKLENELRKLIKRNHNTNLKIKKKLKTIFIPQDNKNQSITYRIKLNHRYKTLKKEEVEIIINYFKNKLNKKLSKSY